MSKYLYLVDTKLIAYFLAQRGGRVSDMLNKIAELLWEYPKGKIGLAFDVGKSRYRSEMYSGYKAQRAKYKEKYTPEQVLESKKFEQDYLSMVEICKRLPVKVLAVKGVEADDLISIFTEEYSKLGYTVRLVTADMDYVNSVVANDNVAIINAFTKELIDKDFVKLKYGDLLSSRRRFNVHKSIFGDKSDNIKFIRGFGEVKAKEVFELIYAKHEDPSNDTIVEEILDYTKKFTNIKVHENHVVDGRTTIKEAFEANMLLADTFVDTSKFSEQELKEYNECLSREVPMGVDETDLMTLSIDLLGTTIVPSMKAKAVFNIK